MTKIAMLTIAITMATTITITMDEYCDDDDINDDGYDDSFVTMPISQSGTWTSLVQLDEPG